MSDFYPAGADNNEAPWNQDEDQVDDRDRYDNEDDPDRLPWE